MKKLTLLTTLILFSLNVFSWEYLGVKSGMTREEVMQVEGFGNKKKTRLSISEKVIFGGKLPYKLDDVLLKFTPETEVLYKMDIYVREDSNSIKQQAMENILIALELSQGMNGELTDYNQRTDYGVNKFKVAILVDSKIFLSEVELVENMNKPAYLIPAN